MKVALINTPYLHVYGKANVGKNCSFPLGLGYIASFIRQSGHHVRLYDPEAEDISLESLYCQIENFQPDLIGITSVSSNYPNALAMVQGIRKKGMNVKMVYGGVHASAIPERVLADAPGIDVVVVGEGEHTVLELLENMEKGKPNLSEIKGICYRKNGETQRTPKRPFHVNVDEFPFPARDLLDLSNYRLHAHFDRGVKSATILSSRGCPSSCTFCANLLTMGRRFRPHSPDYSIKEIKHLINDYGITHFHIVDDLFLADKERARQICQRIIDEKLNIQWFIFGRVDNIDLEILRIMKKAGCFYILFGIESGDEEILKKMGKNVTLDQCRRATELCDEVGIMVLNSFIIGNDGETHESVQRTINFAKELKSVFAAFSLMVPFVGTPIFNKYYKDMVNDIHNWQDWSSIADQFSVEPKHTVLSNKELLQYTNKAYIAYYGRFSQIIRILHSLHSPRVLWIYLRGSVGIFRKLLTWRKHS